MRLFALMGLAFVALLTSAAGATAKSAAFKTGTYKLKPAGYTVTLKRTKCGGKVQLCVALPKSPSIQTKGGPAETVRIGNFATPVALPSSGKVTEHAPTVPPPFPGAAPGQSVFSVAFKKNGTLTGFVEVTVTEVVGGQTLAESGKVSFTGKLG